MRMLSKMKYWTGALLLSALVFTACDDEEGEAPELEIEALTATGTDLTTGEEITVDLNAPSSASDVPPDAIFEITFDREVDAETANASNISVSDGDSDVEITIDISGSIVTVTPNEDLIQGTDYTVSVSSGLTAADGGIISNGSRTFETAGRLPVEPAFEDQQVLYINFDGNAIDLTGNYADGEETAIEYVEDRFGRVASAASFDGDESIIEVLEADQLMETSDFTLSVWVQINSEDHVNENGDPTGHFIFGLGGFYGFQMETNNATESVIMPVRFETDEGTLWGDNLFFNGDGMDNTNGGWQGSEFRADLESTGGVPSLLGDQQWAHLVYTYDSETMKRKLFINGEVMQIDDFTLWPEDSDPTKTVGLKFEANDDVENILALGFIRSKDSNLFANDAFGDYYSPTSNHFKGLMDDFRVFHAAYSEEDVEALYEAERP